MIEKHSKRLFELAEEFHGNKNLFEFLELYGILLSETELFDALKGVIALKNFMIGFKVPQAVDKEV